jgi:predicted MFS family arabinose efflux permease
MIRETPTPPHQRQVGLGLLQNLRAMPRLAVSDRQFALFVAARFFRNAQFILIAFLSIHCQKVLNAKLEFLGQLVMVMAIGAIVGNVVARLLGLRAGSKLPMVSGTLLSIGVAAWAIGAATPWEFRAIFFLLGAAPAISEVGNQALGLSICPSGNRTTFFAIMSTVTMIGMLSAAAITTWLRRTNGEFRLLAIATMVGLALTVACLLPIRDPRRTAGEA